jgi:hypothetical protein
MKPGRERVLNSAVASAPFPDGFPCQNIKPGRVSYVTDEFCAAYRSRSICFDCGRGRRLSLERADALGILPKIVKKENGEMATGTCECCSAFAVMYKKGGVNRCYQCHKTEAVPANLELKTEPDPAIQTQDAIQGSEVSVENQTPAQTEQADAPAQTPYPAPGHGEVPASAPVVGFVNMPDGTSAAVTSALGPDAPDLPGYDELSWDDFEPIAPQPKYQEVFFSVHTGGKFAMSCALSSKCNFEAGDRVLVRLRGQSVAVKKAAPGEHGGKKLTPGRSVSGGRLAFGARDVTRIVGDKSGRFEATITSWGFVAHLDRPMQAKG